MGCWGQGNYAKMRALWQEQVKAKMTGHNKWKNTPGIMTWKGQASGAA